MAVTVELTAMQLRFALEVAYARRMRSLSIPRGNWGQTRETALQDDFDGALGEQALAHWLGVSWDGGKRGDKDVAGRYQVRTTSWPSGHLCLHREDADEDVVVLVLTHAAPRCILRGWIIARDGKVPGVWGSLKPGRPAFNVPQSMLRPMHELPGVVVEREIDGYRYEHRA